MRPSKLWEPRVINNSLVPVWLSLLAPINIWAITLGYWIFCKGELSEQMKRHETIHFQQQLELLLVGQWLLYLVFWLVGLVRYRNGAKAYKENPFEREAYSNEADVYYLFSRKRFAWVQYIRSQKVSGL